jgi:hypothetical protein
MLYKVIRCLIVIRLLATCFSLVQDVCFPELYINPPTMEEVIYDYY